MGLVMEGLFALGVLLLALWLWSLRGSIARDEGEAQRRTREEQAAREQARHEAQLHRQGEKLRCLACGATFVGPLPETGCPQCHLALLVVTEREYQRRNKEKL